MLVRHYPGNADCRRPCPAGNRSAAGCADYPRGTGDAGGAAEEAGGMSMIPRKPFPCGVDLDLLEEAAEKFVSWETRCLQRVDKSQRANRRIEQTEARVDAELYRRYAEVVRDAVAALERCEKQNLKEDE